MNKVLICGRLTRDPDVRYTQESQPKCIARITVAVDRKMKKDSEENGADFIPCVAFGKTAEFIEKYLTKGIKVIVEGRWQTGSYVNKDGQKIYTHDCVIESVEFAESKKTEGETAQELPPMDADGFINVPEGIDEKLPFA